MVYGVTDEGFEMKRLDVIEEEIHEELTEAFGFDTRLQKPSLLDVLITTFSEQIAELWETAQDSYYAKFPATATGVNLDNAVQYGGITREPASQTSYMIHCTGDDGTEVGADCIIASDTTPQIRLYPAEEFEISRDKCNSIDIIVASIDTEDYVITMNGEQITYIKLQEDTEKEIIQGLKAAFNVEGYTTEIIDDTILRITDNVIEKQNVFILSSNLTTASVTSIATFFTEEFGKFTIPDGLINVIITSITGLKEVTNKIEPTYGRDQETDVELRHSYIAKSALRSTTMIGSIIGELLENVSGVVSASGYEYLEDQPHAEGEYVPVRGDIEIIVDGGDNLEIANAILNKKAAGVGTYGDVSVDIVTDYGDTVNIRFNRPQKLYTWFKVVLHGSNFPTNYSTLTIESVVNDISAMNAGQELLVQQLIEGIYHQVAGTSYVEITSAHTTSSSYVPQPIEYTSGNIEVLKRQKVVTDETRIEVILYGS